jgi:predicted  nucleic acid-binding Zn-ribbon protein
MSQNSDDLDEIPSIVPERDELVSHRKRKRGSAAASAASAPRQAYADQAYGEAGGTSGWVTFFITILVLGLLGTSAAGYYFYQQGLTTADELLSTRNRLMQIETRLSLVDEAAADSAASLVERVDFNFSEIDKLWAARNQLRTDVGDLKALVDGLKVTSTELVATVDEHENVLTQSVATMEARITEINRNFAGMDNLGTQLTQLNADLNRVKTAMTAVQDDVEARLSATEQDIESINVYRLQLNQTLTNLQNSINRLQQGSGQ